MRRHIAVVVLVVAVFGGGALAQERIALPTRPSVTQPVLFTAARAPVASVILFPGASGAVASVRQNFLLRVADRFVAQGINVAVADAPSDHAGGMGSPFRYSPAHATDIAAIIAFAKSRAPVPVWLVGTSRGSISAANGAARIGPPSVAGVVLTSSVWEGGMLNVALGDIAVPVLVVHNHDDGCHESPFGDTASAMARMQHAPIKELIAVSGGSLRGSPCDALSPHGYYGIEDQAVPAIIAWIKAH
jgi:hypothetical protein